jgi:triacylglycerol lipase
VVKNFSSRIWAACAPRISTEQATTVPFDRAHSTHNRVLLVHGVADSPVSMRILERRMRRDGRHTLAITLKGSDGSISLESMSLQLRDYVQDHFPLTDRFDLVGFSMGGLVCRHYVQILGGSRRVDRLVTISTPNHGTLLAFFNSRVACNEMRRGSESTNLNRDCSALRDLNVISFWTPWDLMILPAKNSRMPVGTNMEIPALAHPLMILQQRPLGEIAKALSEPVSVGFQVRPTRPPLQRRKL